MSPSFKPWIHSGETLLGDDLTRYRSIVGSCLYYAVKTREDCLYAASTLARYFVGATSTHMRAAHKLLAYMYHTRNKTAKIYFEGPRLGLTVYTDASFITDLEDCRSVYGIKIFYGRSLVHFVSKKIRVLCSSTTEAEHIALAQGIRQGYWMEQILQERRPEKVIDMYSDSQSALKWAREEETKQSRYIPLRYHIARQAVLEGRISITYIQTDKQPADELTKAKMPPERTQKKSKAAGKGLKRKPKGRVKRK